MTEEYIDVPHHEWWCPTDQRWCDCPGPCPDGSEHYPDRHIIQKGIKFEILPDHPLYGKAPYGIKIIKEEN